MQGFDVAMIAQFVGLLLVAGALAGLMAGLLGVGGGMIIVPVLFYVFTVLDVESAHRMHMAVGTSLATIVVTSVMSVRAHWRRNSIDWALVRSWAPWLVLGVVIGSVAAGKLDASGLKIVFGGAALIVAAYMAFVKVEFALFKAPPQGPAKAATATSIGGFSTLIGIGGGTFTVPVLVLSSVAPRIAVGTAAAVGIFIAIPAAAGFVVIGRGLPDLPPFSLGYVSIPAFLAIIPMTSLFAPVGARIAHAISPKWLKRAFAVFLLVNGTNILLSA
jgi:uncharacterized protein